MIKFLLPLFFCCSIQSQIVIQGGSVQGATLGVNVPAGGGGDITSNLEAWWKFDAGSGTTAIDSTGNGHTATLNGTTGWTTGMIGPFAVAYPGSTGNGCSLSAITTTTTFTYAAWIFYSAGGAYQNLFAEGGAQGLWINSSKIDWVFSGTDHRSTTAIGTGAWHHIAVVSNAGAVTFYLDGAADGTTTGSVSFAVNGMGADSGTGGEAFNGNHDDVRLYFRALSALDIATLYAYR